VFAAVILQASPGVRRARDIRRRLERRLDCWDQGHFTALIDDTEAELKANARPRNRQADPEVTTRAFDARVLTGRLRSAVRHLTSRQGGGVLQPADLCTKSGRPVVEVLREKHPDLREPPSVGAPDGAFEPYARGAPAVVPVDVTAMTVKTVAAKLSGAAGPGGVDAVDLRNWLLRCGVESEDLREEMAAMTAWLANMHPPWAAYRALMACRLVALDKQPGVRPVGIGESYRRLMAKCLLEEIGHKATTACGNRNLCAGLPGGIEGAVHAVATAFEEASAVPQPTVGAVADEGAPEDSEDDPEDPEDPGARRPGGAGGPEAGGAGGVGRPGAGDLPRVDTGDPRVANGDPRATTDGPRRGGPDVMSDEGPVALPALQIQPMDDAVPDGPPDRLPPEGPPPCGLLLVDARNGFNELGRKAMLGTVRNLWAGGGLFAINCYRHAAQLVLRVSGADCITLLSREGVTQGAPSRWCYTGSPSCPSSTRCGGRS
jgi:hypothetical protein